MNKIEQQPNALMKRFLHHVVLALWLGGALTAHAALTVYYLRHAEGGHNATADFVHRRVPTNAWPAWVGNPNVFTPTGLAQVNALSTNLLSYKIDFIAVSPLWRTRHTILPYLKRTKRTAEIWPELTETASFSPPHGAPKKPASNASLFSTGTVKMTPEEARYFRVRADGTGNRELKATNLTAVVALAQRVEKLLRARGGTNDYTVLLVGHGNAGLTLIRQLTRNPHWHGVFLRNATMWMAREKPDGSFALQMLNGAPYPPPPRKY